MDDPRRFLGFALERYPERVEVAPADQLVMDSARAKPNRPAFLKLAVPDHVVQSLRGAADRRTHSVFLVAVPKEVEERSESRIVLPGEVEP